MWRRAGERRATAKRVTAKRRVSERPGWSRRRLRFFLLETSVLADAESVPCSVLQQGGRAGWGQDDRSVIQRQRSGHCFPSDTSERQRNHRLRQADDNTAIDVRRPAPGAGYDRSQNQRRRGYLLRQRPSRQAGQTRRDRSHSSRKPSRTYLPRR